MTYWHNVWMTVAFAGDVTTGTRASGKLIAAEQAEAVDIGVRAVPGQLFFATTL